MEKFQVKLAVLEKNPALWKGPGKPDSGPL